MGENGSSLAAGAGIGGEEMNFCAHFREDESAVFTLVKLLVNVFGLLSNGLVVYVYQTKRDKHPSEYLILSLGLIDLNISLCSCVFMGLKKVHGHISFPTLVCKALLCAVNGGIFTFSTFSSAFLVFVITVNRYIAICHPYDYRGIFTKHRITQLILSGYLFGLANSMCAVVYCFSTSHILVMLVDLYWYAARFLIITADVVVMVWAYQRVIAELNKATATTVVMAPMSTTGAGGTATDAATAAAAAADKQPATRTCSDTSEAAYITMSRRPSDALSSCAPGSHMGSPKTLHRYLSPGAILKETTTTDDQDTIMKLDQNAFDTDAHADSEYGVERTGCGSNGYLLARPQSSLKVRQGNCISRRELGDRASVGNKIRGNSKANRKLTKTLFLVSLLFLVSHIPVVWLDTTQVFLSQLFTIEMGAWFSHTKEVSYIIYLAYFDCNPVIYFACNQHFRTTVITLSKKLVPERHTIL